jgi:endonuclease G
MAARQDIAKSYLTSILPRRGGLEAIEAVEAPVQPADLMPHSIPDGVDSALVEKTVEKVAKDEPLEPIESFALEAIIIPDKRPAIDIINGDFTVDHPLWRDYATDADIHGRICKALPSVGRIELPGNMAYPYGGTGFVVGPNLLMTNRHVAGIFADGLGVRGLHFQTGAAAGVDFLKELGGGSAYLDVRGIRLIHPYWDMALLEVEGLDATRAPLRFALGEPDSLAGRKVAVIGYPAFDPRNDATVQNQVFRGVYNVKRLQPGLAGGRNPIDSFGKTVPATTHDASTLGGNSGSLILDVETGLVLGLHFGGLYLKRNYGVPGSDLGKDGRVIDAGLSFEATPNRQAGPWDEWWTKSEAAPRESIPAPAAAPAPAPAEGRLTAPAAPLTAALPVAQTASLTVPLTITVTLGAQDSAPGLTAPLGASVIERAVEPIHDGVDVPRAGYDTSFLGIKVPLPDALDLSVVATMEDGDHVIPYHHFSLVMHKRRRLALFTASNVDATPANRQPEAGFAYTRKALTGIGDGGTERWFTDPRLRGTDQLPDRFFEKDMKAFDKGHLVRRDDVAWGRSFAEIQAANGDTYHTTNCSPQVAGFNRSNHADNWGALEDVVLKQAKSERYCLFSGPVLADDDPVFLGVDDLGAVRVQIPREFWKVVVARGGSGLQAFGFLLTQDLGQTPLEFTVPDTWVVRMIPLAELEGKLRLVRFPAAITTADQYGRSNPT